VKSSLIRARACLRDRAAIAFDSKHFSRRSNQPGRKHSYISDTGAEIQDALAGADAGFPEKSFGVRCETSSLSNQALVFCIGAAERVPRSSIVHYQLNGGFYHDSCEA
jgi:hypothetical protein